MVNTREATEVRRLVTHNCVGHVSYYCTQRRGISRPAYGRHLDGNPRLVWGSFSTSSILHELQDGRRGGTVLGVRKAGRNDDRPQRGTTSEHAVQNLNGLRDGPFELLLGFSMEPTKGPSCYDFKHCARSSSRVNPLFLCSISRRRLIRPRTVTYFQ